MSPPRGAADDELVAAVREGDDLAFEELYRRYHSRIRAFVYGFVRDDGRAEDVTQEAFLSALRRMRDTSSPIAFRPWIYEIARNGAIDLYRRTSRAEEVSINADSPLAPTDRGRLVGSDAPESALRDKERIEHLCGALDELSDAHHRILVLRELEGRSYREIGDQMELTPPAVESTLFRARRRLEKEYSEIDTGRRCAAMGSIIAQLAEGVELPRERRKLERHALRCSQCRKRARELGVEPMRQGGWVSRAAALLPLPAILRRRSADASWTATAGPAVESGGTLVGKAGALLAAAALAGGGGATLGGYGPLAADALHRDANPAVNAQPKAPGGAGRAGDPAFGGTGVPPRASGTDGPSDGGATKGRSATGALPNTGAAAPQSPGGAPPGEELPGVPSLEEPGVAEPQLQQPEIEQPQIEQPGVEDPRFEPPTTPDPDASVPDPGAPPELELNASPPEPPAAPSAPAPSAPPAPTPPLL